jgi:MSHA biogenesis protein MshP
MAVVVALLAAVAVLGASLVVVFTTQQAGSALDLEGVRAYHASRAGLEWGMYHVLRPGFAGCTGANGIQGKTVPFAGNLAAYRATLTCTSTVHEEGSANITMFEITSTACNDPAGCPTPSSPPPPYYVERQLRVSLGSN